MKLNPFNWMNQRPSFRVLGGWLLLAAIGVMDWASPAITLGPVYCLPVIMISYDVRRARGVLVAIIAGLVWMFLSTSVGNSIWRSWQSEPIVERLDTIPSAVQKELVKWGVIIPPMDPKTQIPAAAVLSVVGTAGFMLVAMGFHTIRAQEEKLAEAERDRLHRERELLDAIVMTLNHEINNPLAIIAAQADLMEVDTVMRDDLKSIHNIQNATQRITKFVKELAAIEEIRLKSIGATRIVQLDIESRPAKDEGSSPQQPLL